MWRWRRKNEFRVPAQIEMDASQTRDYCIAKSATLRAVRPKIPHYVKNACQDDNPPVRRPRRKPRRALLDRTAEGGCLYVSFSHYEGVWSGGFVFASAEILD
jgi:hypothetical protein